MLDGFNRRLFLKSSAAALAAGALGAYDLAALAQDAGQRPERCRRRHDRRFIVWTAIALLFTIRTAHRVAAPPPAVTPSSAPAKRLCTIRT